MKQFINTLKRAASEFINDDCMSSGAAIAYYSIFALPPLLVVIFGLATRLGVSEEQLNRVVKQQLGMPDASAAASGEDEADGAARPEQGLRAVAQQSTPSRDVGVVGRVFGIALLLFTATGLFSQLQLSLNRAWEVAPDPEQGGLKRFFLKRLLSFGMILIFALLLLVSMVFSTVIGEIIGLVQGRAPSMVARVVGFVLDNLATLALGTALFAAIYKILPDAEIKWRDTIVGALFTSLLFIVGKALIAVYLQRADLASGWGAAAGSLIAVLAWLYYSSLIVLFGAELMQVWTRRFGQQIQPAKSAVPSVRSGLTARRPARQRVGSDRRCLATHSRQEFRQRTKRLDSVAGNL
jgi:membrane protein